MAADTAAKSGVATGTPLTMTVGVALTPRALAPWIRLGLDLRDTAHARQAPGAPR